MHDARKISNYIISNKGLLSRRITNLRINKLLYFIHGWYLARNDQGLIKNHFEAWEHGPVVKVVYDAFKKHGDGEIVELATYLNYASGKIEEIPFSDLDMRTQNFINRIALYYDKYSTRELVTISHDANGPWARALHRSASGSGAGRLEIEEIRSHFQIQSGGKAYS